MTERTFTNDYDIIVFYFEYQIFPSDYIKNCVVTPLPDKSAIKDIIPEDEIPILNLEEEIVSESTRRNYIEHPSRKRFLPKGPGENLTLNRTRSGKVFKPQKLKQKELKKRYPGYSNKQLQKVRDSLRKDGLIL